MNHNENNGSSHTWKISVKSPVVMLPALEEIFISINDEYYPTLSNFEIEGDKINRLLEVYFDTEPDLEKIKIGVKNAANIFDLPVPDITIEAVINENWVAASQKLLQPIDAGRFYLYGAHDKETAPRNKISILMEAGQAFGTGSHETTKGCLLALSDLPLNKNPDLILDLGCGSGVLAIAAAKQWNTRVIASDIDPIATLTADGNIITNNIKLIAPETKAHGIATLTCDGFQNTVIGETGPYNLIIANILALPLKHLAPDIAANLGDDGMLILSGLLDSQESMVLEAYEKEGLKLKKRYSINEWHTLVLKGI